MKSKLKIIALLLIVICPQKMLFSQYDWQKHAENPVIVFDEQQGLLGFSDPSLLFDGTLFHLWISGGGFISGNPNSGVRVYYFTSADGISWMPFAANPVFRENAPGTWDSGHIETPSVIFVGNEYRLYYVATPDSAKENPEYLQLGLATSADGTSWQRHAENPLLRHGNAGEWDERWIESPCVVQTDSLYYMWYNGVDAEWKIHVGLATSADGVHWQKHAQNPVFSPLPESAWESAAVYAPQVRVMDNEFVMLYTGVVFNETGYDFNNTHTGVAVSSDWIHWTRRQDEPVLSGTEGAWDSSGPFTLDWLKTDQELFMLYVSGGKCGAAFAQNETKVNQKKSVMPRYSFMQNYPNPFNSSTLVSYSVSQAGNVDLAVYDLLGRIVKDFGRKYHLPGLYQIRWDATDQNGKQLAGGIYFCRLSSGEKVEIRRLVLVR